jgi:hypothetical protein
MDLRALLGVVAAAASVEPNRANESQEMLAEEENDANAAFLLLLKRQEEAQATAGRECKSGQGAAAQPRKTSSAGAVGCAAKPRVVGQRQRQEQQQPNKDHNHSQAHEMQRSRASGNPQMGQPKAKGNPARATAKGKGTCRAVDSAPNRR